MRRTSRPYLAPSAFEVFFTSSAHEPALLRETAAAFAESLQVAFPESR